MSSNTIHSMFILSPVSQSLMKGMGVSVLESTSMDLNIAGRVYRELIPGILNIQLRNGGLRNRIRLIM